MYKQMTLCKKRSNKNDASLRNDQLISHRFLFHSCHGRGQQIGDKHYQVSLLCRYAFYNSHQFLTGQSPTTTRLWCLSQTDIPDGWLSRNHGTPISKHRARASRRGHIEVGNSGQQPARERRLTRSVAVRNEPGRYHTQGASTWSSLGQSECVWL